MQQSLAKQTVVLLGVGHTNAHVLKMWRMQPLPDTQLICISNHPIATYSGMMPGVLAGNYDQQSMEIDLVRLCQANGARLIVDNVTGVDAQRRNVLFEDRPPLNYDALSIGIGSVPSMGSVEIEDDAPLLAIKPMQNFLQRLREHLERMRDSVTDRPLQIFVVGGGAGGVEIAFCLPNRIKKEFPDVSFELHIVHGGESLLPGHRSATSKLAEEKLRDAGAQLHLGRRVVKVTSDTVTLDDVERGDQLPADLILWATSAKSPPLLDRLVLRRDPKGFLLTKPTLQSVSDEHIFAVGDTGTIEDVQRPKSGVFAVRQGPILWSNIGRLLRNRRLLDFNPQSDFLKLLNLGNGRAIGEYKGKTFEGRSSWWWKDRIDRRFMAMYQDYEPKKMSGGESKSDDDNEMRCLGCGGKVGGGVLKRALAKLDAPQRDEVIIGLDDPDDAAVLRFAAGSSVVATTDFFAAPLDDPYIVGRLSALNALSDVWAMGGSPTAALTIATIPFGGESAQASFLAEALAGSLHEFRKANTALVGGHTIEGPRFTLGFTILGASPGDTASGAGEAWTKSGLSPGDQLILTKPLGAGVLLAAAMRADCRGDWYMALLDHLVESNFDAAEVARSHGIQSVTDVTGFGLAGHLLEMLVASDMDATLKLESLPLLDGAESLIKQGVLSTLDAANRAAEAHIQTDKKRSSAAAYAALFDPQTSGGLLLAAKPEQCDSLLKDLKNPRASIIGEVQSRAGNSASIQID